jgi:DNA-binding response OmpR family regulator
MGAGFYGDERVVDVHLAHVRKKLGPEAQRLETVRAFGYRWRSS